MARMREVVINRSFGYFSLSQAAFNELIRLKNRHALKEAAKRPRPGLLGTDMPRDDKDLVTVVKRLKAKANGTLADLRIVKVPGNVTWYLETYEGAEWVAEKHRTWGLRQYSRG